MFGSLEPGSDNIPTRGTAGARSRGVNRPHGKIQMPPLVWFSFQWLGFCAAHEIEPWEEGGSHDKTT